MIIRGNKISGDELRKAYPIHAQQALLRHFAVRVTRPDNPFGPHRHEAPELWYIIEGQAIVALDGQEQAVEAGDLVILGPWVEHGLQATGHAKWLCLG